MLTDQWRTSSYSGGNGCVAARVVLVVEVADSKTADSPILSFGVERWRQFVAAVRDDEFRS